MSADFVCLFNHRSRIGDVRALEEHERERHQQGVIIDCVEKPIEIEPDRIR